jgi:hypothetical protein
MRPRDGASPRADISGRQPDLTPNDSNGRIQVRLAFALIWFVAFSIWFYSFGLPNNRPAERWMVWRVLPFDLLDIVDPPVEPNAAPWSWLFLGQRIPFLLIAGFVWFAALGIGRIELRSVRLCRVFDRLERLFFAGCLGLASVSLLMLGLGLLGTMSRWPLLVVLTAAAFYEFVNIAGGRSLFQFGGWGLQDNATVESRPEKDSRPRQTTSNALRWLVPVVVAPFVFCLLLGAMSPQTDFDVVEYHLGGPKEWFQQGHIARLPHNVYTSFPFLTEMLLLSGMVLYGDWEWGALAGQAVLAGFAPLTALGLFATGRRWFSESAGWLAALVWLTTPWAYRISIIAYAEGGLACYLFAGLAIGLQLVFDWDRPLLSEGRESPGSSVPTNDAGTQKPLTLTFSPQSQGEGKGWRFVVLLGVLAGCAMSCKYTGAVSAVVPLGLLVLWVSWKSSGVHRDRARNLVIAGSLFAAGVFVAIGPWLMKNWVETGNPVFPLAFSIFGGEGRDAAMDAQWRRGHSAHYASASAWILDLPVKLTDVVANNDWHSVLMFGLAPIALLASWRRKVWCVWAFIGWQFAAWFLFTHHIDRFYVPMFPAVALLAGVGGGWLLSHRSGLFHRIGKWLGGSLIAASILFNAWIMQNIGGFNAGRLDLKAAREIAVAPAIRWLNAEWDSGRLPHETKVLCVGEAALFHAKFPYLYNTVFDRSVFEQWCRELAETGERTGAGEFRLRPAEEIRATMRRHGITHILVNWAEILRYREPGSYGYTDFVHPDRFDELQAAGILSPSLPLPDAVSFAPASDAKRRQVAEWAPRLSESVADRPGYRGVQVFSVKH